MFLAENATFSATTSTRIFSSLRNDDHAKEEKPNPTFEELIQAEYKKCDKPGMH